MTAPLLSLHDLTVRFGGLTAVDSVNLTVEPGEIVGLIGPNGAGKSTTFGAVAGAVRATQGRIQLEGRDITRLGPAGRTRLGVGRTFQNVRLFRSMTVGENVLTAALTAHRSLRDARQHTAAVLDQVGLAELSRANVAMLPLADQKRTEIARALATQPKLLLLDEMMSGLIPAETEELVATVKSLRESGTTLIVVEHVLRVIHALADRVLVLDHGAVIAEGTPAQVTSDDRVITAYLGRRRAAH